MSNKIKTTLFALATLLLGLSFSFQVDAETIHSKNLDDGNLQTVQQLDKAILTTKIDSQGRPWESHWIGSDKDEEGKRVGSPSDPLNISDWKQFQNWVTINNKERTVWDRGHLIGNQFAGKVSNVPENIVAETYWMNQKLMTYFEGGMKSSDENALDNWLYLHPNYYLDYTVTANYETEFDKVPTSVTLKYAGLDKQGNVLEIKLPEINQEGIGKQSIDNKGYTSVTIQNILPEYSIDYQTGKVSKNGEFSKNSNLNSESEGNSDFLGLSNISSNKKELIVFALILFVSAIAVIKKAKK